MLQYWKCFFVGVFWTYLLLHLLILKIFLILGGEEDVRGGLPAFFIPVFL